MKPIDHSQQLHLFTRFLKSAMEALDHHLKTLKTGGSDELFI